MKVKIDIYQQVTDKILDLMQKHGTNWAKPWKASGSDFGMPYSVATNKNYQGINIVLLWSAGYSDSRWGTFKAWQAKGASVKKGEKGTQIIYFSILDKTDEDGQKVKIPLLRASYVFNAQQCENVPEEKDAPKAISTGSLEHVENFVKATGANIGHGGDRAYYMPSLDRIQMPHCSDFDADEFYYSTLLHELTHWTGHKSRLDRDQAHSFGSAEYAYEELIAELGSTFLCAELGVENEPREDHAIYLNSWIRKLQDDKKAIVRAASAASKACRFLHGEATEYQSTEEEAA